MAVANVFVELATTVQNLLVFFFYRTFLTQCTLSVVTNLTKLLRSLLARVLLGKEVSTFALFAHTLVEFGLLGIHFAIGNVIAFSAGTFLFQVEAFFAIHAAFAVLLRKVVLGAIASFLALLAIRKPVQKVVFFALNALTFLLVFRTAHLRTVLAFVLLKVKALLTLQTLFEGEVEFYRV